MEGTNFLLNSPRRMKNGPEGKIVKKKKLGIPPRFWKAAFDLQMI
jgi:hypothetical protein